MTGKPSKDGGFSPFRRWLILLNVLVACLSMLAVVVMVNYIASHHFKRFHWTQDTRFQLSPLTVKMLESLTNEVKVTVYFDSQEPLFSSVADLIKEYQLICPKYVKADYVDYLTHPNRAALVKARYRLNSAVDKDLVIFDTGTGPPRIIYEKELSEYDWSAVLAGGKEVRRTAFKGEQLFSSAIMIVSDPKPFKAYFLRGHGEHDPENEDEQSGYTKFAQLLQEKNISATRLSLQTNDVPADCQLLIIAGPRFAFSQLDLEKVDSYLSHGGRALILLMNTVAGASLSGLEQVLANWGVEVGDNLVLDKQQGKSEQTPFLLVSRFGEHPIMKPLNNVELVLGFPRSVRHLPGAQQAADTAKVTELAFTSDEGKAVRSRRNNRGTVEASGKIPLLAAVEKGAIQGVKTDRGATRIVVVGDSFFLVNANIDNLANREFASLAVNWLLDRAQLLNIGPRPIIEYKILLSESNMITAYWVLLAGMPGSVLALGLLVWLRRRK